MSGTDTDLMMLLMLKKENQETALFLLHVLSSVANLIVAHQLSPQAESQPSHPAKGKHKLAHTNPPVHTLLPRIWLIAALSFRVHSATTFALISFMYNMKAFRGFLI